MKLIGSRVDWVQPRGMSTPNPARVIQLLALLIFACAIPANGQLTLHEGQVYTKEFTALPETITFGLASEPNGGFYIVVSDFEAPTDRLQVDMFEDDVTGPVLTSFVQEATSDGTGISYAWQDFQGAIRLTMLSGSVTVEKIVFFYEIPDPDNGYICERHQLVFVPKHGRALIDELVPCSGPLTGGTWKNHGQYVAAVNKEVRRLLRGGELTKLEAHMILRDAARAKCGKKR
jgi:hypothetical protein